MDNLAARTYQWSNRAAIRALAAVSMLFGLVIIGGGGARFNYSAPLTVAAKFPGGHAFWGVLATLVGSWTIIASVRWHRRAVMYGMLAETVLFAFFTVTLVVSAAQQPTSPLIGIVAYGGYSLICAIKYVVGHGLRGADRE